MERDSYDDILKDTEIMTDSSGLFFDNYINLTEEIYAEVFSENISIGEAWKVIVDKRVLRTPFPSGNIKEKILIDYFFQLIMLVSLILRNWSTKTMRCAQIYKRIEIFTKEKQYLL